MTIFGTPGGTPLNTSGFQGTAPGNAVQATLQPTLPGVGLFPPNSNNASGDSVMASMARGGVPANSFINNQGVGASLTLASSATTGDGGTQAQPAAGVLGSGPGGGGDVTARQGGANMNNDPGRDGDVVLGLQLNPGALTYQGGGAAPTQFAG